MHTAPYQLCAIPVWNLCYSHQLIPPSTFEKNNYKPRSDDWRTSLLNMPFIEQYRLRIKTIDKRSYCFETCFAHLTMKFHFMTEGKCRFWPKSASNILFSPHISFIWNYLCFEQKRTHLEPNYGGPRTA
jgi:hypothetical protein